jgi:hypothetical protein
LSKEYKPVTAEEALAPTVDHSVDQEAAERAEKDGVIAAAYVDYEKAMENYEGRSDVETLAHRRAREVGASFEDAAFRRKVGGEEGESEGGVVTSAKATPKKASQEK